MQSKFLTMMTLVTLLAGCTTQPVGVSVDQAAKFREQGIVVGDVKGASSVALKTKGQAVTGMVLASVASSIVASNPSSISPQGMQEAQQAGDSAGRVVQSAVSDIGHNVQQAQTPAYAMATSITHSLNDAGIHAAAAAYHIDIKQDVWMLSYDSLFGSDNYRLHWQLSTSVLDGTNKVVSTSVCQGDGDTKQALDAWKADDYAAVKNAVNEVGERCAKQFLGDMGLHG
ncbi:hypothetical protein DWU98_14085 [Dyella monticola]|uniref:Lipoprotein n=1 Tax=Dyella monticola TaxID=1927958 RepID=A0A370WWY8_9GAMM|nr:hypothetical protein [Dyella monticola]RDS80537.1 hypothetical protein DWU98_14085 [Dyella monticola]